LFIVQITDIELLNDSCFMPLEAELKLPIYLEANTESLLRVNRRRKEIAMNM